MRGTNVEKFFSTVGERNMDETKIPVAILYYESTHSSI